MSSNRNVGWIVYVVVVFPVKTCTNISYKHLHLCTSPETANCRNTDTLFMSSGSPSIDWCGRSIPVSTAVVILKLTLCRRYQAPRPGRDVGLVRCGCVCVARGRARVVRRMSFRPIHAGI